MELNLQKQTVCINEIIYDGTCEQPLECDVLLPDHCPDIQKILRCEVNPVLLTSGVNGDRLSLEGMAVAQLYYLEENGCMRHAEYKIPYTKTVELRAAPQCPSVQVSQSVDYFNCRAVSGRRLDMRGAVSIHARVSGQVEEEVVCGAKGMGLQLRRVQAQNTQIFPQAVRQLTVHEQVELGYGKPIVGTVLRSSAFAEVTDHKTIAGKLITKGEAAVKILYQCEGDEKQLEVMEYALPISQIIDIEGVDEDCVCVVWYEICGVEVSARPDEDGECRGFTIDLSINACAVAHRQLQLETACDCYSTAYECKQTQKSVPFIQLLDVVAESCLYKETLALPPKVEGIVDLWCVPSGVQVRFEKEEAIVSGRVQVCMFAYEQGGEAAYFDQMREFTHRIPVRGSYESLLFAPVVRAEAAAFTMGGQEKFEVRCSLKIKGALYHQTRKKVICEVAVDESHKKAREKNRLYLCYSEGGEPVWEIAKRYHTEMEQVLAQNPGQDETDGRRVLLIPMGRAE